MYKYTFLKFLCPTGQTETTNTLKWNASGSLYLSPLHLFLCSCYTTINLKISIVYLLWNLGYAAQMVWILNDLLFNVSAGNHTAKLRRGDGTKWTISLTNYRPWSPLVTPCPGSWTNSQCSEWLCSTSNLSKVPCESMVIDLITWLCTFLVWLVLSNFTMLLDLNSQLNKLVGITNRAESLKLWRFPVLHPLEDVVYKAVPS